MARKKQIKKEVPTHSPTRRRHNIQPTKPYYCALHGSKVFSTSFHRLSKKNQKEFFLGGKSIQDVLGRSKNVKVCASHFASHQVATKLDGKYWDSASLSSSSRSKIHIRIIAKKQQKLKSDKQQIIDKQQQQPETIIETKQQKIEKLEQLIDKQQQQLDSKDKSISNLKDKITTLKKRNSPPQPPLFNSFTIDFIRDNDMNTKFFTGASSWEIFQREVLDKFAAELSKLPIYRTAEKISAELGDDWQHPDFDKRKTRESNISSETMLFIWFYRFYVGETFERIGKVLLIFLLIESIKFLLNWQN